MGRHYIPRADAEFDAFQANLISVVNANLGPWLIPSGEFTALKALQTTWQITYAVTKTPQGDNPVDNKKKNDARDAYEAGIRQFVNERLRYNSNITDADKVNMRLTVRDKEPTDVPVPATQVLVDKIDKDTEARHTIHFRDENTPDSKAKPFGVHHAEIRYKVGEPEPASAEDCINVVTDTETPITIEFKATDAGKRVYYFLRWVNNTSKPGPWTTVQNAMIT